MTGWLRGVLGVDDARDAAVNAAGIDARAYEEAGEVVGTGVQTAANMAAEGQLQGANITALEQQRALGYLQERERLPIEIRDEALGGLRDFYQVPNQPLSQEQLIEQARSSPLYDAILSSRGRGEEAIMRTASATGGLRSGNTIEDLAYYNTDLENRALLTGYSEAQERDDYSRLMNLQGLEGLGSLQGNEGEISRLMTQRGATLGAGYTGAATMRAGGVSRAAQANADAIMGSYGAVSGGQLARAQIGAQGTQNALDLIMGAGQMAATVFCDIRLKEDIRYLGTHEGINFYGWEWNELAAELGLEGPCSGVLAHEIYEIAPEATSEKDGFIQVDYSKIPGVH